MKHTSARAERVNVEIICVGEELLSGITANTNADWLCKMLTLAGARVTRTIVLPDEIRAIAAEVSWCITKRFPDFLVITGGLGTTYDDLTLEGVAKALGRRVALDKKAVEMLKESYRRRSLPYHKKLESVRLKMARIPEGSTPLQNPIGSAPAVWINNTKVGKNGKTAIFCLPGVPMEMKSIFSEYVLPEVKKRVGQDFVAAEINYLATGISESMIAPELVAIVNSFSKGSIYLKTHPLGYGKSRNKFNIPRIRIQIVSKGEKSDADGIGQRLNMISKEIKKQVRLLGGRIQSL